MKYMIILKALFVAVLIAGTAWLLAQEDIKMTESIPEKIAHFPHVSGSNLHGQKFNLPNDFEGELNIVIVAFRREQQRDVNTWLPHVKEIHREYDNLAYYELPTIRNMNALSQWFINQGMRSGIPDSTARHITITLYIDKEPFTEALNITTQDEIHTFLVTRDGDVLWRALGLHSPEKERGLRDVVEKYGL